MHTFVLLTEDALAAHDVARVAQLASLHEAPVRVHVLVPIDTRHNRVLEVLDELALGQLREAVSDSGDLPPEQARVAAAAALEASITALSRAGLEVGGALTPDDPVAATAAAARDLLADEVVVLTPPHLVEEAFHRDWASRLRTLLNLPVLHVVAGTDRVL